MQLNRVAENSWYRSERQIHLLRDEEGIDERDIYVEKESGRQFERPVYRSFPSIGWYPVLAWTSL